MRKWIIKCLCVGFAVFTSLICIISAHPINADSDNSNSVTISPTLITASINSGSSYTYPITVSAGYALTIETAGLGQTTDGSNEELNASQDTGPDSARTWVSIDKTQMAVGNSQTLNITVSVPSGFQASEDYACVYMYGSPTTSGSATIIPGVIIPIIITVNPSAFTPNSSGQTTSLSIPQAYAGQALDVLTTLSNNGNCLLTGTTNSVTIKDSSGNIEWQNEAPVSSPSIIPGYPRIIDAKDNVGLSLGNYSVESDITLNGAILDTKTINFTVINPPPVPAAPVLTSPGNSVPPGASINTLTPNFQWNSVSSTDYYILSVSRTPYSTANLVYTSQQITGTLFTLPAGLLFNGQSYCWQVTATNVTGTSPSPNTFFFQTSGSYGAPAISTVGASNITATSATLSGNLSSLGSSGLINVNFAYGKDTSYGNGTPGLSLSTTGTFVTTVTGLTPATTYHFQANAKGVSIIYGNDMAFTTLQATTTTTTFTPTTTPSTTPTTTATNSSSTTTTTATTATSTSTTTTASLTTEALDLTQYVQPGVDPSSMTGLSFNDSTPYIDATQKADTEVTLNGVSGNGSIIIGKYDNEPSEDVAFSAGTIKGGTGESGIKFVFVQTVGYDHGTAQITVNYTNSEISGYDQNSLILAYFSGSKWVIIQNATVSLSDGTITGDVPVSQLTGGIAIGLGGNKNQSGSVVPVVSQYSSAPPNHGISWSLVGIVIGLILIVGTVVFIVERNRRRTSAD
jgi:hypothetical protein